MKLINFDQKLGILQVKFVSLKLINI